VNRGAEYKNASRYRVIQIAKPTSGGA
jgi:hypothetical protein